MEGFDAVTGFHNEEIYLAQLVPDDVPDKRVIVDDEDSFHNFFEKGRLIMPSVL
jgi:hypothetical protein